MQGYQCGMVWGTALAAGAQAYRRWGARPQAEAMAIVAAQRLVESFRAKNKSIDCREITGIDLSAPTARMIARFLIKSAPSGTCFGMAARCAGTSFREIEDVLSQKPVEAPPAPVSCAAMLAQKMGASDLHTVMAAGLAGGIGLSGGACGALGAALWISRMNGLQKGDGRTDLKDPAVLAAMERFARCTGQKFECSQIVGRKFENVADHAGYVGAGGCSELIDVLAAT